MYSSNVHYKPIQNKAQLVHYLKMCFDNLKKVDFHIFNGFMQNVLLWPHL